MENDPKIAKLTLEMFMNNNYYKKYLSTSDPLAYKEHQDFLDALTRHRYSILDITKQLLNAPETQITAPVLETFRQYVAACIKYIEHRELEERSDVAVGGGEREWSDAESDHEDLFARVDEDGDPEPEIAPFPKSFWGTAIRKKGELKEPDLTEDLSEGKSFWGDIRAFSNK